MGDTDPQVARYSARTAFIGAILGATIGGAASFASSFVIYHNQRDTTAHDAQLAADVKMLALAETYRTTLADAVSAADRNDSDSYSDLRKQLRATGPQLYAAVVRVELLTDLDREAVDIIDALFAEPLPTDPRHFPVDATRAALDRNSTAMVTFIRAASPQVKLK